MIFKKLTAFISSLLMTACSTAANPNVEVVSPTEFQERLAKDETAYLIDSRTPDEYNSGHLSDSHLLNWLDTDEFKKQAQNIDKSATIYIYCRSGRRSNQAANYLAEQGYNVIDMKGGILAWEKNGLPTTDK